jgi:CheY-specific phosphatase CheX
VSPVLDNTEVLGTIIREVTPQLFQAYGTRLTPESDGGPPSDAEHPELAGVLGFVGERLHGTITLATSRDVMRGVIETIPGVESVEDWLAELTNQLLGRVKGRLLHCGAPVMSSTPVVVAGNELEVKMGRHTVNCRHRFKAEFRAEKGTVQVWLGVEVENGFVLDERSGGDRGATEGDLLLF